MSTVDDAVAIGAALARVASDLISGFISKQEAHRRVREILPEEGASERAARELVESMRLERLAEVDDPTEEP